LPIRGHVALILPRYGRSSKWSLGSVGIYRFAGSGRWETFQAGDSDCPITLSLW